MTLYMTGKESAYCTTGPRIRMVTDLAGARTHDLSTTDKKPSTVPMPLLGPVETYTHIGFLGCIHLISG